MRDYRKQELKILIITTIFAVICLTSINFLINSIHYLFANTAAEIIGGDRVISSRLPIDPRIITYAKKHNLQAVTTINFYSMLTTEENLALVTVKAAPDGYPLRGKLYINGAPAQALPKHNEIWLEERALLLLGVELGDNIYLGDQAFKVSAILSLEPDRVSEGFSFAPRALINYADLESTAILQPGSRVNYRLLISGEEGALDDFDKYVSDKLKPGQKLIKAGDKENFSHHRLEQATRFLNLAIIINIILAAVVTGFAAYNYMQGHMEQIAIIRCIGATTKQIASIYVFSLTLLAIGCGLIGGIIGFGVEQLIAYGLHYYTAIQLPLPDSNPIWLGLACAFLLIMGLALPSLLTLQRVTPLHILRKEVAVDDNIKWFGYWLVISLFLILLYFVSGYLALFRLIILSVFLVTFVSLGLMYVLFALLPRYLPKLPSVLQLSIANIRFNLLANSLQVLAFALVICVVSLLYSIHKDLLDVWRKQIPAHTPNYFAINIEQHDLSPLQQELAKINIVAPEFYPVLRGQLTAVNGASSGYWRSFNITWTMHLPKDNKILDGSWFAEDQQGVSIETKLAERLGIKVGDMLTFEIDQHDITTKVTSIRSVDWDSFNPNFYVIYAPNALPKNLLPSYIVSFYVPDDQNRDMVNIARSFPGINFVGVAPILDQATMIINLLSALVAYILAFTLMIGFALLLAIMLPSIKMRIFQNNLLRVLGATPRQIVLLLLAELISLGAVAGVVGALVAIFAVKFFAAEFLQISYEINYLLPLYGAVAGSIFMLLGGYYGTRRVLQVAPMQLLQDLH